MTTFAIIKTNDNYKNLNGKRLKVVEQHNNFITCQFMSEGRIIKADFGKSEILKIWTPVNISNITSR